MKEPSKLERPIRVLIVDDHEVVHWGLRMVLERLPWIARSFSARSGAEALARTVEHQIDLALVDLFVGTESGPEICERLKAVRPEMRMLLISGVGQISPQAAAACGANGFVSKDSRGADIVRALGMVASGMSVFEEEPEEQSGIALSDRERQVLALVAAGATNREIANELHLSPYTVKEYASALYRKLDVRNRVEAVLRAEKLGLIA